MDQMDQADIFKNQASVVKWNFILSMFREGMDENEKIRIACNAGVANPDEMSAILSVPITGELKERMVSNLIFQGNPIPHHLKDEAMKLLLTKER